jgi:hypothetical protein
VSFKNCAPHENVLTVRIFSTFSYYVMGKRLILNIEIKQITCVYFDTSLMSASVTELMVNISDKSKNCLIIE